LVLQIAKFVIDGFAVAVGCDPVVACVVIGLFVDLLALVCLLNVLLLSLAVCALFISDVKNLTGGARSALFTVLVKGLVGWAL
jgi:hypothetical protein